MRILEVAEIFRLCSIRRSNLPRLDLEFGLAQATTRKEFFIYSQCQPYTESQWRDQTYNRDNSPVGPAGSSVSGGSAP